MKLIPMLSAATFVVALSLSGAHAQSPGEQGAGGSPSMSPNQGASGGSDMGPSGSPAGATQEGQASQNLSSPNGDRPQMGAESDDSPGGSAGTKAKSKGKSDTANKAGSKSEGKGDRDKAGQAENKAGSNTEAKGDRETSDQAGSQPGDDAGVSGKTGSTAGGDKTGKGGKSVRLESQQVSKVKTYFSQHKPSVRAIDKDEVSVSIGIALPGTIALYDLPPDVIVVSGACPIKYFAWGDDIVLVDSCTREVVEIIVGVA
jgi:hypothetical protein